MRHYEAVIFDMDGLILDTEPIALKAWQMSFGELGFPAPSELFQPLIGRNSRDSLAILRSSLAADFPLDSVVSRLPHHHDEHIAAHGIPLKQGLESLLDFLDANGTKRAVATSTQRDRAWNKLRIAGVDHRFEILVGGDEIENGKPAPDIYLAAAEKLGVSPKRCLALEDSEPGLRAAIAAGMTAVMIPDLVPPTPEIEAMVKAVVPTLCEVRRRLEGGRI